MFEKNNKKQPSDKMHNRLKEIRQKIESSAQKIQQDNDTPTPKQTAILRSASEQDLFPEANEIINPEINIARHADFIFCSPRSKKMSEYRERKTKNGNEFIAISPTTVITFDGKESSTELRTPTVTTARIFYALIQIWEEQGRGTDGWVMFSGADIFRILKLRAGKQSYQRLYREISVLKGSVIHWNQMFSSGEIITRTTEQLNFITHFRTYVKTNLKNSKEYKDKILIQIHPTFIKNIIIGNVKPFLFREYLEVSEKSYDGAILYTKLDLYLSSGDPKKVWRRKVTELLKDLGIEGSRYKTLTRRREKAEELAKIVNGRRISRGKLRVTIVDGAEELLLRAVRIPEKDPRIINIHQHLGLEGVKHLVSEMVKWVGFEDKKQPNGRQSLVSYYARSYPENVILDALSYFRSDAKNDPKVRSKKAIFTVYLHREVHRNGLKWIGKCEGKSCKYQKDLFA